MTQHSLETMNTFPTYDSSSDGSTGGETNAADVTVGHMINHQDDLTPFVVHENRTLFVGNLSFFCEDKHLHQLVEQYAHIEFIRILFNRRLGKSLMYGFVTVSTDSEADEVVTLLDGHLFMGRRLKVALAKDRNPSNNSSGKDDSANSSITGSEAPVKVHVSFCSHFQHGHVVLPTEVLLRKIFQPYGRLLDVTLKAYHCRENQPFQEGHGVLLVASSVDAANILDNFSGRAVSNGFQLTCSLPSSHHRSSSTRLSQQPRKFSPQQGFVPAPSANQFGYHRGNGHISYPAQRSASYSPPSVPPIMPMNMMHHPAVHHGTNGVTPVGPMNYFYMSMPPIPMYHHAPMTPQGMGPIGYMPPVSPSSAQHIPSQHHQQHPHPAVPSVPLAIYGYSPASSGSGTPPFYYSPR